MIWNKHKKKIIIIGFAALAAIIVGITCIIIFNNEVKINLTDKYSDKEYGFSFGRPSDWQISTGENDLVLLKSPNGEAEIRVMEYASESFDLFTINRNEAEKLFTEPDKFIDLSDTTIGTVPAKLLVSQSKDKNGQEIIIENFCYEAGYSKYSVICTFEKPYERALNKIMESFSVDSDAPLNTIASNEIIYRNIPMKELLHYSAKDIKKEFGEPLKTIDNNLLYKNASFFFSPKSGKIEGINIIDLELLSIHGYPGKNLAELSKFQTEIEDKSNVLQKELEVKPTVYSYQQGAYKFEYKLKDYTMLSICGEYSDAPRAAWFISNNRTNDDNLCYNGISVDNLFKLSYNDVLRIYGEPLINSNAEPSVYGGDGFMYNTLNFPADNISFTFSKESDKISSIQDLDENFLTLNNAVLEKNPDEFSKLLGEPVMSDSYDGSIIGSLYTLPDIAMEVMSYYGETTVVTIKSQENTIPYNAEELAYLIGGSSEQVYSTLGIPNDGSSLRSYIPGGGVESYKYGEVLTVNFNSYDPIAVDNIIVSPWECEYKGITLEKTKNEIENVLGSPDNDGYWNNGHYYIEYFFNDNSVVLRLVMPDSESKVEIVQFEMNREDNFNQYPNEEAENNNSSSSPYTADGYLLSPGSMVYAKEGFLGLNYVQGYVKSIDGNTVKVEWQYIYSNNLWGYKKYELYGDNAWISNMYKYYDSTGNELSTVGLKSKYSSNELYAELPGGETVGGSTAQY